MNANCQFRRILAALMGLTLLGLVSPAHAEEIAEIFPHATSIVNNTKTDMEAGLEYAPDRLRLRLVSKFPFSNPKDEHPQVQFDEAPNSWRLGLLFEWQFLLKAEEEGTLQHLYARAEVDWGVHEYSYYPDAGQQKETISRESYAAKIGLAWLIHEGKPYGYYFMPQLSGRYDHSWKEADKVGVVVPGENGLPSTVSNKVISEPSVSPLTTVRLSLPFYPGWRVPLAFGPSVAYGWSSKNDEFFGSDLLRRRIEGWIYFFPKGQDRANGAGDEKTINVRLGIAPFWDRRIKGEDKQEEHAEGVLVQLRVGVLPLEY